MAPSIVAVLAIGVLLGFRHAFEPDHLAAVSTLAARPAARFWSAARLGLVWGLGHTVTVGAVVLLVLALGVRVPERFWPAAELLVAGLLILLGCVVIWRYVRGRWHLHTHSHVAAGPHFHLHSHASGAGHGHNHQTGDARRSLGFGIAHGLAGSGAIVGMLGVSLTLSVLVRFAAERGARWATILHVGAAAGSVVAGVILAQQVISTR